MNESACPYHSGLESRVRRSEEDIQKLFDKFGTAVGLMYKVDKKMEGIWGKLVGVAACAATLSPIILKLIDYLVGGR